MKKQNIKNYIHFMLEISWRKIHTHTHTHTHTQCVSIEKGLEWNTLKYQKEPFFGWWNYEYFYFFFYIILYFSFFFFFVYYLIPKNPFSKHALKSFNNVENAFYR